MKWYFAVGITLLCVVLLFTPVTTKAAVSEAEYRATLLELIASLRQQIALLQAELLVRQSVGTPPSKITYEEGFLSGSVTIIDSYIVTSPADVTAMRNKKQRDYFQRVLAVFPDEYEKRLGKMAVFADKKNSFDAFVETVPPMHTTWLYAVHEATLDQPSAQWNTELMVHELAHIISYDSAGLKVSQSAATCASYFKRYGCPAAQAYLQLFANEFWTTADLTRVEQWSNRASIGDVADRYYKTHKTDFVSSYAAGGPEEDFAESFMFFVFDIPVTGEIAQRKVDFFTQFADLRAVKSEITEAVGE